MAKNKKIKSTTISKYSAAQLWRAVERRTDDYRIEFGRVYKLDGNSYVFHCTTRADDEARSILQQIGAVADV